MMSKWFLFYDEGAETVSTQTVREPASSRMELCLLLAAIALKFNTASIKAIKVNKTHWMKFPLAALAKRHL